MVDAEPAVLCGDCQDDNAAELFGPKFAEAGLVGPNGPQERTVPPNKFRPHGVQDELFATAATLREESDFTFPSRFDHNPKWRSWTFRNPQSARRLSAARRAEAGLGWDESSICVIDTERPAPAASAVMTSKLREFSVGEATMFAVDDSPNIDGILVDDNTPWVQGHEDPLITLLKDPNRRAVLLGEYHSNSMVRAYLIGLAARLRKAGVTHLCIEAYSNPMFDELNRWGAMPPEERGPVPDLTDVRCAPSLYGHEAIGQGYRDMAIAMATQGIKIVPFDRETSWARSTNLNPMEEREQHMADTISEILDDPRAKALVLVGDKHVEHERWRMDSLATRLGRRYSVATAKVEGGFHLTEPITEDGLLMLPAPMDSDRVASEALKHLHSIEETVASELIEPPTRVIPQLVRLLAGDLQMTVDHEGEAGREMVAFGVSSWKGGATYSVGNFEAGMKPEQRLDLQSTGSELVYNQETIRNIIVELVRSYNGRSEAVDRVCGELIEDARRKGSRKFRCTIEVDVDAVWLTTADGNDRPVTRPIPVAAGVRPLGEPPEIAEIDDAAPIHGKAMPRLEFRSENRGVDAVIRLPQRSPRSLLADTGKAGTRALETLNRYGISVSYGTSYPVSSYDPVRNHIDLELWEDGHAGRLVEEVVRARAVLEGQSVRIDPRANTRDTFIHGAHEENAAALVERIQATLALQHLYPSVPAAPWQTEYVNRFTRVLSSARNSGLIVEEQRRLAERAGYDAVFEAVENSDFRKPGIDWDNAAGDLIGKQTVDGKVHLFHTTALRWANSIREGGFDTGYKRYHAELGEGLYTAEKFSQKGGWIKGLDEPVAMHIVLDRVADLDPLDIKILTPESHDIAKWLRHFMTGGAGRRHDLIIAPLLRNLWPFLDGEPPKWGANQWVFYGNTGAMLNRGLGGIYRHMPAQSGVIYPAPSIT